MSTVNDVMPESLNTERTEETGGNGSTTAALGHAEAFVAAVGEGAFARIAASLDEDACLTALLPGGLNEWRGAAEIARVFEGWFGEVEELTVVSASVSQFGPCIKLHWRLRVVAERLADVPVLVEQYVFADPGPTGRINAMSLLCSGFVRDPLHV